MRRIAWFFGVWIGIEAGLPEACAASIADTSPVQLEICQPTTPGLSSRGSVQCSQPNTVTPVLHMIVIHTSYFLISPPVADADTRSSAARGNPQAMVKLSHFYRAQGDVPSGLVWLHKAVAAGEPEGMFDLGNCYLNSVLGPPDYIESLKWFTKSADAGFAPAMAALGSAYAGDEYGHKDDALATHWFRQAALHGNVDAMMATGVRYSRGAGVSKSGSEAARWFREAYAHGNVMAASFLGPLYDVGDGVPADPAESAKWYLIAAEHGDGRAAQALSDMYAQGRGVHQDPAQAARWAEKAKAKPPPLLIAPRR